MSWPTGLTITKAHDEMVTNPDGTTAKMHVHGGPFYFNPNLFKRKFLGRYLYIYWGFRPTAPWAPGYGDEGILGFYSRQLKRIGWGNFATLLTIRVKPVVSN